MESEAILTFPIEKGFVSKPIETITGEEFIKWLDFCYPGGLTEAEREPNLFGNTVERIQICRMIIGFWSMWNTVCTNPKKPIVANKK